MLSIPIQTEENPISVHFGFFSLYFSPLFPGSSRAATHSCQLPSMCCPSMPCAADATHTIHLPWRMEPVSRVRQQAQPQRPGSCGVCMRECRLQACSPSTCPHFHLSGIALLLQMRCLGSPMHRFDLNLSSLWNACSEMQRGWVISGVNRINTKSR